MPTLLETTSTQAEPTVARSSARGWRRWLRFLLTRGRDRLQRAGWILLLGLVAGLAALSLFAELADEVADNGTQALDTAVLAFLHQFTSPALDTFFIVVSSLGGDLLTVLLIAVVTLFAVRQLWGAAVALILVTVGANLLNSALKLFFERPRPTEILSLFPGQSFSFPSGHAMVSAAFYLFLAYVAWRILNGWRRQAVAAGLVALVLLIGLSRLYLGVHYLSDVVAGYLAGFLWADSVILAGRTLARRRTKPDAPPESGRSDRFSGIWTDGYRPPATRTQTRDPGDATSRRGR